MHCPICSSKIFDQEGQARAGLEPEKISDLVVRHPFGLSFIRPPQCQEAERAAVPSRPPVPPFTRETAVEKFVLPRVPGTAATRPASRLCIRGWISYYSHFYKTRLRPTLKRIDAYVIRWRAASSSGCAIRPMGHETGSTGYIGRTPSSSPNGLYVMATAEHREPCDSRGSCTVLGAPRGEIPPGDSTTTSSPIRCG